MNKKIHQPSISDKRLRLIYTLIFLTLSLLALWGSYFGASLNFLDESNSISIEGDAFLPSLAAKRIALHEVGINTHIYKFNEEKLNTMRDSHYKLIVSKPTDNAIRVFFNNQLIIDEGDFLEGKSIFKNSSLYGTIENALIEKDNVIKVETYAQYKSGIERPIILCKNDVGLKVIDKLNLFYVKLIFFGIGFMFFSTLFPLYIYIISIHKDKNLLYMSLATFSLLFYFGDFIKIYSLPFEYFLYKKIVLFGLATGIMIYAQVIKDFFKSKMPFLLARINYIVFICIMVLSENMIAFKNYYEYWFYSTIFLIVVHFLFMLFNNKSSVTAYIFMTAMLLLSAYSVFVVSLEFQEGYFIINSPLLYMVLLSTLPLLLGFDAISEKDRMIVREQELKENAFLESLTDNLTGTWNQRYLDLQLNTEIFYGSLAMFDFDNFKQINDSYGHLAGDYLLQQVSKIILRTIRNTDELCRYGGDEFVILFNHSNVEQAKELLEEICTTINAHTFNYQHQSLQVTLSIGLYESKDPMDGKMLLRLADRALYAAKQEGKNTVYILKKD